MLPPALDEAVSDLLINLGKCRSLPLPAGLPLGLSWSRSLLGRAFIWANFIPKIAAVGALYLMASRAMSGLRSAFRDYADIS
jgi:hypothetical protein